MQVAGLQRLQVLNQLANTMRKALVVSDKAPRYCLDFSFVHIIEVLRCLLFQQKTMVTTAILEGKLYIEPIESCPPIWPLSPWSCHGIAELAKPLL